MKTNFSSGFIAIVGSPNVGKSTLLNAMIRQKVAIVSDKAQTTRNQIRGILTRPDYQMVFIDTPGIHQPKNKLGDYMVRVAYAALNEIECILFMLDPINGFREKDENILKQLKNAKAPVIALMNKADIATAYQMQVMHERLEQEKSTFDAILEISAATGQGLQELEKQLCCYLVPGPQYFPDDMITDQPERIICAEMIREAALQLLREEIPHGIGVDIDKMNDRENQSVMDIWATIYCEKESHKRIIIGKNGSMLKQIGSLSRKEMEWLLGRHVNLQLWIKVRPGWRDKMSDLRMLGYKEEK